MYCTNIIGYDIISAEAKLYTVYNFVYIYKHTRNDLKGDNANDTLEKL